MVATGPGHQASSKLSKQSEISVLQIIFSYLECRGVSEQAVLNTLGENGRAQTHTQTWGR